MVSAESSHAHCEIQPSCRFVGVLVPALEDSFLFLKSAHAWEKLCARTLRHLHLVTPWIGFVSHTGFICQAVLVQISDGFWKQIS